MKRELLNEWVRALRSGNYKQARGALCIEDTDGAPSENEENLSYCCLGVLCNVMGLKRRVVTFNMDNDDARAQYDEDKGGFTYQYEMEIPEGTPPVDRYYYNGSEVLPEELRKKLGITDKAQRILTEANDNGQDFEDIATMLEDNIICEDDTQPVWVTEPLTERRK